MGLGRSTDARAARGEGEGHGGVRAKVRSLHRHARTAQATNRRRAEDGGGDGNGHLLGGETTGGSKRDQNVVSAGREVVRNSARRDAVDDGGHRAAVGADEEGRGVGAGGGEVRRGLQCDDSFAVGGSGGDGGRGGGADVAIRRAVGLVAAARELGHVNGGEALGGGAANGHSDGEEVVFARLLLHRTSRADNRIECVGLYGTRDGSNGDNWRRIGASGRRGSEAAAADGHNVVAVSRAGAARDASDDGAERKRAGEAASGRLDNS